MKKIGDLDLIDNCRKRLEVVKGEAVKTDKLALTSRIFTNANFPMRKRDQDGGVYIRRDGKFSLKIVADPSIGIPYGVLPRLIIIFLAREAVVQRNREIVLGRNLSDFMRKLGLKVTGGKNGTIGRLMEQMRRLGNITVTAEKRVEKGFQFVNIHLIKQGQLIPDRLMSEQQESLFANHITLGEEFYNDCIQHPVPLSMDIIRKLKSSPMALDLYTFLTYRLYNCKGPIRIKWTDLEKQFGSYYKTIRHFRLRAIQCLERIREHFPAIRMSTDDKEYLVVYPGSPSVRMKRSKVSSY